MAPEVTKVNGRKVLGERFRHIVPAYSIIGMLFAREGEPRMVVKSSGVGTGQHDPTTWQLLPSGVEEALSLQPDCQVLNEAIATWAAGVPLDERERVTDEVFDALEAGGAKRFDEIAASPDGLQQVLRALGTTDERTRNLVTALVEGTVNSSMGAVRKAVQESIEQWRRDAQGFADEAARRLQRTGGDIRVPMSALGKADRRGRRQQ